MLLMLGVISLDSEPLIKPFATVKLKEFMMNYRPDMRKQDNCQWLNFVATRS